MVVARNELPKTGALLTMNLKAVTRRKAAGARKGRALRGSLRRVNFAGCLGWTAQGTPTAGHAVRQPAIELDEGRAKIPLFPCPRAIQAS